MMCAAEIFRAGREPGQRASYETGVRPMSRDLKVCESDTGNITAPFYPANAEHFQP